VHSKYAPPGKDAIVSRMTSVKVCTLVAILQVTTQSLGAESESCEERFSSLVETYDAAAALSPGSRQYIEALFALEDDIFVAMNHCPDDVNLLSLQGETQIALGRYELAVLYGKRVVGMAPDSWRANAMLGGALASNGAYGEGATYLARAAELAPDNLTLKLNLCNAYRLVGDSAAAAALCEEVAEKGDERQRAMAERIRAKLP
jgi:FimV-like protein